MSKLSTVKERNIEDGLEAQSYAFLASKSGLIKSLFSLYHVDAPDEDEPKDSRPEWLRRVLRLTEFAFRCKKTTRREIDFALGLAQQLALPASTIADYQDIADSAEGIIEHEQLEWGELLGPSLNDARQRWVTRTCEKRLCWQAWFELASLDVKLKRVYEMFPAVASAYGKMWPQIRNLNKARVVIVPPLSLIDMFRRIQANSKRTGVKVSVTKAIIENPAYNVAVPDWQVFCVGEGTPLKVYQDHLVNNAIAYNKLKARDKTSDEVKRFWDLLFQIRSTTRNEWRFLLDEFQSPLQPVEDPRLWAALMMQPLGGDQSITRKIFTLNPSALKKGEAEEIVLGGYLEADKNGGKEISLVHTPVTKHRVVNPKLLWSVKLG